MRGSVLSPSPRPFGMSSSASETAAEFLCAVPRQCGKGCSASEAADEWLLAAHRQPVTTCAASEDAGECLLRLPNILVSGVPAVKQHVRALSELPNSLERGFPPVRQLVSDLPISQVAWCEMFVFPQRGRCCGLVFPNCTQFLLLHFILFSLNIGSLLVCSFDIYSNSCISGEIFELQLHRLEEDVACLYG
jgi:hypothetical protein